MVQTQMSEYRNLDVWVARASWNSSASDGSKVVGVRICDQICVYVAHKFPFWWLDSYKCLKTKNDKPRENDVKLLTHLWKCWLKSAGLRLLASRAAFFASSARFCHTSSKSPIWAVRVGIIAANVKNKTKRQFGCILRNWSEPGYGLRSRVRTLIRYGHGPR